MYQPTEKGSMMKLLCINMIVYELIVTGCINLAQPFLDGCTQKPRHACGPPAGERIMYRSNACPKEKPAKNMELLIC